ncbi:GNAT family N-acetyltransferase [Stappia sp. ES.058]|uniref:GNAT family N-acetyltransferase n=1 Tax=Stappia sp. ES.058 TaxID=1881061 RepID=UPI00087CEE0F|nr:GNAT family N-acetyltransferase [Stappia sp. ES.058]SDU41681.1 Acetyltransferase (GNAT) family protein [Stappia sp. ES.058]
MTGIAIQQLSGEALSASLDALAAIIAESVKAGAAIGFMLSIDRSSARAFWETQVFPQVREGNRVLLVAVCDGTVIGTVQLETKLPPNQPHRCEVSKMAVHPDHRRKGVARALMRALEARARALEKTLITLDTKTGDPAQSLYRSLGYAETGVVPGFAFDPDGKRLHATTYMYKAL